MLSEKGKEMNSRRFLGFLATKKEEEQEESEKNVGKGFKKTELDSDKVFKTESRLQIFLGKRHQKSVIDVIEFKFLICKSTMSS